MASVKEDIQPLIEKHWELVALNQGAIKLNPDWERYAELDAAGMLPDSRAGATGYHLIKYAENHCKENGVSLLNINTKVHIPFDSLMERMDFELTERLYSKYLGNNNGR